MSLNNYFGHIFITLVLLISNTFLKAQELKVRNVRFEEIGEIVRVKYDLDGMTDKKYRISLSLSDDFGKTFKMKPRTVYGDVGKNIQPGLSKQITWYILRDFPEGLSGDGFVFAVDAELQKGGNKLPFYLLGAGVAGGVVYFVVRSSGEKSEPEPTTGSIVISVPTEF